MSVRVRYAPSPTGSPHVGNLRTALYCWLFAKHHDGKFLARLEDTDRSPERYMPASIGELEDALQYLGTIPDEGWAWGGPHAPYVQSEKLPLYKEVAERLIAEGKAYRCYCTKERLDALRQMQQERGVPSGYDRQCRGLPAEDSLRYKEEGQPYVVRLAMPLEGKTVLHDAVRGDISYENRLQDDQVLLKSDGFPTYFLACTVDDRDMEITHILRGEEWLGSASKMLYLYEALGWEPPIFVHLPLIVGSDRKKLSKRHGATQFQWFVDQGYLPEALINFLSLLGWSTGDENRELLTVGELIERFDLGGLTDHPAIFDYEKLKWMNGHYLRECSPSRLQALCLPYLIKAGLVSDPPTDAEIAYAERILPLEQERMKTLAEVVDLVGFFFLPLEYPNGYDEKAAAKWFGVAHLKPLLEKEIAAFEGLAEWTTEGLEAATQTVAAEMALPFAQVVHPTRVAATGRTVGPGLFETLWALGRERVLERLRTVLAHV